jgi:hypothetical protein
MASAGWLARTVANGWPASVDVLANLGNLCVAHGWLACIHLWLHANVFSAPSLAAFSWPLQLICGWLAAVASLSWPAHSGCLCLACASSAGSLQLHAINGLISWQ